MESKNNNHKLELLNSNNTVHIYVSESEDRAIQIAANNLLRDIEQVFQCKAILSKEIDECRIIIGTLENISIAETIENKQVSINSLRAEDGSFHWEAFLHQVIEETLYIIGTDRRGTIYGIYDLCEEIGVSPWYYWADVPVRTKKSFSLPTDYLKADWPSVQYRGIFINDEEELNDWAKLHTQDGTIGPAAYRSIFELLLRLKANYIWPAMHVNYFNENPINGKLAQEMGIVVGTSHCDMLLRSNQNEWAPWIKNKGYTDAVYDYSIEGRNREILKEYWRESVELNKDYEVCYTMGMRGIHDSGFHTKTIEEDASLSEEEKEKAKVSLLGQVIRDQRQILLDVLGEEKGKNALQTFVPYKEVLDLYNNGLVLPDDLTLIWANDNYGHMRRYPNEAERKRSGGSGLYFHSSYWAAQGTAMNYLFINSIPLAHTGNELKKSYESGIRKIWVLNIGGLKPVEQDMEFFIRYGWEAGKEKGITHNANEFTKYWINSNFTGNHGEEAAKLYEIFAQVTNVRKIEHMNNNVFSQVAYGDEAGRRLMCLENIFRRGNDILNKLPEEERAGFFQLFLMKIHASYYTNHEYYYADRSLLSYERGNMQAADRYVEFSVRMADYRKRMLYFYNKKMSEGKWDQILAPESFSPPPTAMYPARKPALKIAGSSLHVELWNGEKELVYSIYGKTQKWIELGNQGEGTIPFTIEIKEGKEFIQVSKTQGILQTEKRILVSVTNPKEYTGKQGLIIVRDNRNKMEVSIKVQIEENWTIQNAFSGFIEADGYISIPADAYTNNVFHNSVTGQNESAGFVCVPSIGRYEGSAMMAWNSKLCAIAGELTQNPYLEYHIYIKNSGNYLLELYRFLTLDSMGRIRFGIGIDENDPIMVESQTRDEWIGKWQESIFDNGEKMQIELPYLSEGAHSLKLYMIDNYVTFSKLVIYTSEKRKTNLGPVTSIQRNKSIVEYGREMPEINWEEIEQLCDEFYRTKEEEISPTNTYYATRDFYNHLEHQVYNKCLQYPQIEYGWKRYEKIWKSSEQKDVIKDFGAGTFVEENGIVAIEAEYALENSENAYLTLSKDESKVTWSHLQAETNGRTGFAMHVAESGILWEDAKEAPGLNYKISIQVPGTYHVWLLIRHYSKQSDSCYLSLDDKVQPLSEQFNKGNLHTYNTEQMYYWCLMSDMELTLGEHLFSILARKSQLRVDRIYLAKEDKLPPNDKQWEDSLRKCNI